MAMASRSTSKTLDLQSLVTEAARIELKTLGAGADYWQVWAGQAAKLSTIAGDTLKAIEDDKASVSDTAHRFTEFGKANAEAFAQLYGRLSGSYFEELARLADIFGSSLETTRSSTKQAKAPTAKKAASKPDAGKRASANA